MIPGRGARLATMVSIGFYWFLLVSIGFYWVLLVSIGFYWFLLVSLGGGIHDFMVCAKVPENTEGL